MADSIYPCAYPYVPEYIQGELLYAWVSRLHALNGLTNPRSTVRLLFGTSTSVLSADLPCQLTHFISKTKEWGPFSTCTEVIDEATLFPYFGRFMAPERRRWFLDGMSLHGGIGLKSAMGLLANGFGATVQLKSCITCDRECQQAFGCTTWLRVHQLPGVVICPIHGCSLHLHAVQSTQANRPSLHVSHSNGIEASKASIGEYEKRFSILSSQALFCGAVPLSDEQRVRRYCAGIEKLGLGEGRRICWEALAQLIGDHYDWFNGMYCRERLLSSEQQPLRWLRDLCLRPERNMHPICHILLAGFLYEDLNEFFSIEKQVSCSESLREDEEFCNVAEHKNEVAELDCLLRDQTVSCREVARRVGYSVHSIIARRSALGLPVKHRRKKLTGELEKRVISLAQSGKRVASISRLSGLSPSTIYRILAEHGECIHRTSKNKRKRSEWLQLAATNPSASTTILRKIKPGVYTWLYRHDRTWLAKHCPQCDRSFLRETRRIDWIERDAQLCRCIFEVAEKAFLEPHRKRVSAAFLLRSTGYETMIRRNFEKLPLVEIALQECAESDADFRNRRWRAAESELCKEGVEQPMDWQIIRRSRIRVSRS